MDLTLSMARLLLTKQDVKKETQFDLIARPDLIARMASTRLDRSKYPNEFQFVKNQNPTRQTNLHDRFEGQFDRRTIPNHKQTRTT